MNLQISLQMDKATFIYLLENFLPNLTKVNLVGDVVPPDIRLAVFLSRLIRRVYSYNIAEDYGIGMYQLKIKDLKY